MGLMSLVAHILLLSSLCFVYIMLCMICINETCMGVRGLFLFHYGLVFCIGVYDNAYVYSIEC